MIKRYIKILLTTLFLVTILLVIIKEFKKSVHEIRGEYTKKQSVNSSINGQKPIYNTPDIELNEIDENKHSWIAIDRKDSYNNELQLYSRDNVTFDEDSIVIISKKEIIDDKIYTSGLVESTEAFKYGYFEFEIEISKGKGLFPAIWLLPISGGPLPEIDIFEMIGSEPNKFYGVVHFEENNMRGRDYFEHMVSEKEQYTVALKWDAEFLTWYIDEQQIYTTTKGVPHEYMYIIINQAVGGNWPGSPDDNTIFPNHFKILSTNINPTFREGRDL
jgi:beta-glucanase (GH16 family)